ncbi:hypothetical protein D3C76_1541900 [compost metagenome]
MGGGGDTVDTCGGKEIDKHGGFVRQLLGQVSRQNNVLVIGIIQLLNRHGVQLGSGHAINIIILGFEGSFIDEEQDNKRTKNNTQKNDHLLQCLCASSTRFL